MTATGKWELLESESEVGGVWSSARMSVLAAHRVAIGPRRTTIVFGVRLAGVKSTLVAVAHLCVKMLPPIRARIIRSVTRRMLSNFQTRGVSRINENFMISTALVPH